MTGINYNQGSVGNLALINSDMLIIGGGVIGLSIAREMHRRGVKKITLIEKGVCGEESSWAAGGMLGPQAEADEGGAFFDFCSASRDLYPAFAAELLDETGIDIELDRSGTLYLAFTDDDVHEIGKRFEWQTRVGLRVERLSAAETLKAEPFVSPDVRESLFFPNDWQVENRKLLVALRKYAELNGIEIREGIEIKHLIYDSGGITGAASETESFFAGTNILATGAWTSFIKLGDSDMPIKVKPIRGQMLCFQMAERQFRRVIYSRRGYIVPRVDGRILAGSTSEQVGFTKGVTDEATDALRNMAFEIAPSLDGLPVADAWSGLRPFAADGMPVFGSIAGFEGIFVATAHYRNGILLAPLTAKLAADALTSGSVDTRLKGFNPNRFRAAATSFGPP